MDRANQPDDQANGYGGEDRALAHTVELSHEQQRDDGRYHDECCVKGCLDRAIRDVLQLLINGKDQAVARQIRKPGLHLKIHAERDDDDADDCPEPLLHVALRGQPLGQIHAQINEYSKCHTNRQLHQLKGWEATSQDEHL